VTSAVRPSWLAGWNLGPLLATERNGELLVKLGSHHAYVTFIYIYVGIHTFILIILISQYAYLSFIYTLCRHTLISYPVSRRRRRKCNPVPGGITGPLRHGGHKYRDLVFQVGGWTQG
jgi:hypothetical protein